MNLLRSTTLTGVMVLALSIVVSTASVRAGEILLGNVEAKAVATVPNPAKYEKLAAGELVAYLEKISGKKLGLVQISGKVVPPGTIAVGTLATKAGLVKESELAPLARDGFVVRIANDRAAVCGYRDVATIYAAYRWLETLGVRFYGPSCEKIPTQEKLVLADTEQTAKPFFDYRVLVRHGRSTNRMPNLKLGNTMDEEMGSPADIGEPGDWAHSSAFMVPYHTYGKSHPEYFALMKDGTRLHPIQGKPFDIHLCLSNPEVRRIATERILMLMDKQPERRSFTVSQGDGKDWCECDKCKALDAKPGDMTDRFVDFANEIARAAAKKHPDNTILIIAYNNDTSRPPTNVKPEPNIRIVYCTYYPRVKCNQHDLTCEQNREGLKDIEGWLKCCPGRVGICDYPCAYQLPWQPFTSFYAMKNKMDYYAKKDIHWIGYCLASGAFLDLLLYGQSKQSWDPNLDMEALVDEFMAGYYGAAAKPMREYLDYYHRHTVHTYCEAGRMMMVTPEYADAVLKILSRAQDAVADEPDCLSRVDLEKFYVLWSFVQHNRPGPGSPVKSSDYVVRLAEAVQLAKKVNPPVVGNSSYPQTMNVWLKDVAKVDIATTPWYDDPWVKKLLADPQSVLR